MCHLLSCLTAGKFQRIAMFKLLPRLIERYMLDMHLWHIHDSLDLALHSKSVVYKLDCDNLQCGCFHVPQIGWLTCQSCRGRCYKCAVPDHQAVAADNVGNMCL